MLDTNIAYDLIRNPHGRSAARLAVHGQEGVCLSIITAAELRYGAAKKASAALSLRVHGLLSRIEVVPFDIPSEMEYGSLRATLAVAGTRIGPMDLLIAAHALALDVTLVTDNVSGLYRVPKLKIENWLQ